MIRTPKRPLTAEEIGFVEAGEAAIRTYARSMGYTRYNWAAVLLYLVIVALMFTTFIYLMSWVQELWDSVETSAAVDAPHVVSLPFNFPLLLVLITVGLLWGTLPIILLSWSSPRFAEWHGWLGIAGTERYYSLQYHLARAIRRGVLSTKSALDPGRFLRDAANEASPFALALLAVLTVVGAIMLFVHVRSYAVVTEAYVETPSGWTQARSRLPLKAVRRVEIECFEEGRDFKVGYTLILPDGDTVVLLRIGNIASRLAAVEAIDRNLVGGSTPFVAVEGAFDPRCVDAVANRFDAKDAGRVRALLSAPKVTAP